jgi:hypothetical protein
MSPHISVSSAIEQSEQLFKTAVLVDAILVIRGGDAYLVDSAETPDSTRRIPIQCPGLEMKLDGTVGGWMGGPYVYMDRVIIEGFLELGTTRRYKVVISRITELRIFRDGEEFQIKFTGS